MTLRLRDLRAQADKGAHAWAGLAWAMVTDRLIDRFLPGCPLDVRFLATFAVPTIAGAAWELIAKRRNWSASIDLDDATATAFGGLVGAVIALVLHL